MITLECIRIYEKYDGEGDGFLHCATLEERLLLNDCCWSLLDSFVQDLIIVGRGLSSDSFIQSLDEKLHKCCDDDITIQALKEYVGRCCL